MRRFEGKRLPMDWQRLDADCLREGVSAKDLWVKEVGLPLHLLGKEMFKQLGDACGGFMIVDADLVWCQHYNQVATLLSLEDHCTGVSRFFKIHSAGSGRLGQKFGLWKICGEGINLYALNSQVYSELPQLISSLSHQFLGPLIISLGI